MDKRKQIVELIKEDSWHNIPVENTVDKIFSILGVISRRELLLDFAEYSENDKTSTTLDECVDNYLDSIKQ